jgi:hypothetical protein
MNDKNMTLVCACIEILKKVKKNPYLGNFMHAYAIVEQLKVDYPDIYTDLANNYGEKYGMGAGVHYSPAVHVSRMLELHKSSNNDPQIIQETFYSIGMEYVGIAPGYIHGCLSIWAYAN